MREDFQQEMCSPLRRKHWFAWGTQFMFSKTNVTVSAKKRKICIFLLFIVWSSFGWFALRQLPCCRCAVLPLCFAAVKEGSNESEVVASIIPTMLLLQAILFLDALVMLSSCHLGILSAWQLVSLWVCKLVSFPACASWSLRACCWKQKIPPPTMQHSQYKCRVDFRAFSFLTWKCTTFSQHAQHLL